MKKQQRKKQRFFDMIRILVLLIAFSVLLYPTVSNYLYEKNSSKVISTYDEEAVKMSQKEKEQLLAEARAYNEAILGNIELLDPFSTAEKEVNERYEHILNIDGAGMMGYIRIPAIEVDLPIYHGTSEPVLQVGVGHFEGTSFPVGGISTHTVLTGHRGLPSKKLFTDLDELKKGDVFYIKVAGETMAYEVDQILTVLPEETEALSIVPGQDYATLVTCTPYAINTHRMLVRGHRIPYEEAVVKAADKVQEPKIPFEVKVLLAAVAVIIGIVVGVKIYAKKQKKKRRRGRKHVRK